MAFTTPKTGFIASEGFAYTDINATNENIRVLAGGDNTLPLSTDAATAYALAKRDADGDIAFRDIAARDVVASGSIKINGEAIDAIDIEHDKGGSSTGASMAAITRRIYIKRTCTVTIKFTHSRSGITGNNAASQIYKNGVAAGTLRETSNTYTETFEAIPGDYFEVWAHSWTSNLNYPATVSNFLVSSGSTVFI